MYFELVGAIEKKDVATIFNYTYKQEVCYSTSLANYWSLNMQRLVLLIHVIILIN